MARRNVRGGKFHRKLRNLDRRQRRPEAVSIYQNRPVSDGEFLPGRHDNWLGDGERAEDTASEGDESDDDDVFDTTEELAGLLGAVGGVGRDDNSFDLGRRQHCPSFSLRSRDRGRTWESHATLIDNPSWAPNGGYLMANLGHVRFDNGVLGISGAIYWRHAQCFYVSYDNGISWEYCSEIARVSPHLTRSAPGDENVGFNYSGVHRLPDGRLMTSMHKHPPEMPCVAFSEDDGMTWSEPRFITSPGNHYGNMNEPEPERPLNDATQANRRRCPSALVTSDGRIVVLFARRTPSLGNRGIMGVVSDDLGKTWSEEFVVRGDAYSWDMGYQVLTELNDGRIFVAYWFCAKDQEEPIEEAQIVRHVAGTFFRLD